jgi:guanylate kinase
MRLARAEEEMTYAPRFDRVVVNDNLEKAEADTLALIRDFLSR